MTAILIIWLFIISLSIPSIPSGSEIAKQIRRQEFAEMHTRILCPPLLHGPLPRIIEKGTTFGTTTIGFSFNVPNEKAESVKANLEKRCYEEFAKQRK